MPHRAGRGGPAAGEALLACDGIGKDYGGLTVLDGVTLTLPARGLFGLCGPNGAGKSTLLGIVGGSVRPDRGRVLLDGADVTRLPPQQRFHLGVSRTFQAVHLIRGRTVLDNVAVACLTSHRSGLVSRLLRSELAQAREQAGRTLARLGGRTDLRAAGGTRPGPGRADQPADLRPGRGAARLRRRPRGFPGFTPREFAPRGPLGG